MTYSIIIHPYSLFRRKRKCRECGRKLFSNEMIKILTSYWGINEEEWYCMKCGKKYIDIYLLNYKK